MDSIKNTMPPAIETDEVAQLRTDVNVLMEGGNVVSNEMYLGFSRVADRLALLVEKNDTGFTPGLVHKGRRISTKKRFYYRIPILLSQKTLIR